jgi:hypothetical protein
MGRWGDRLSQKLKLRNFCLLPSFPVTNHKSPITNHQSPVTKVQVYALVNF